MSSTAEAELVVAAALAEPVTLEAVPGGDSCRAYRVLTGGGEVLFAKVLTGAPEGLFAAEAAGLGWLAEAGVRTPTVRAAGDQVLVLDWHEPGPATPGAADRLGRDLAQLHRAGAGAFGAPPPGVSGSWVGPLPVPAQPRATAAEHLAVRLLDATVRARLHGADRAAVEAVCARLPDLLGPVEPPARLHGDLWGGNVRWTAAGAVLVDPAAHGGHRETDLAMLALFGCPHLDRIVGAYTEAYPLAAGWRDRVALHQLHPVLVHGALFGGGYAARAGELARRYC